LRVFHAVALRKSFTDAGHDLHLTQQAISFHIRSIEQELDVPLFIRSHHSVQLTKAGAILFAHAERILALYDEASRALAELREESTRRLRIAATNSISKYAMPTAIRIFQSRHPKVQVVLEIGNSTQVIEYLNQGAVDAALVSDGVPLSSNYRVTPLWREQIVFVVSPEHPWVSRDDLTIDDLLATPVIMREKGSGTRAILERELAALGLSFDRLKIALIVGSPEAVKQAAQAGVGVGILSTLRARHSLSSDDLILKRIDGFDLTRDFYVVRPQNGSAATLLNEFVPIVQDAIA
ncbi:MAG: LysR family transcriptional regulator, partial [Rhizobium sp.]|nr:LysR family transcriptional regulator [Rhizobium sp.]